jgi:hypothetical protein
MGVDICQRGGILTMPRPRHPNKEIEAAVKYAEERGWRFIEPGGSAHAWGRLFCPHNDRDGCRMSVWSTPRSPENHARQIRRVVARCSHGEESR